MKNGFSRIFKLFIFDFWNNFFRDEIPSPICCLIRDVGRENVPLVAESEAEKITIIHQAVIYLAFLGLIGFNNFKVFSIDWSRSQCQQITINALNIYFKMLYHLRLNAVSELDTRFSLNNQFWFPVTCQYSFYDKIYDFKDISIL